MSSSGTSDNPATPVEREPVGAAAPTAGSLNEDWLAVIVGLALIGLVLVGAIPAGLIP